MRCDASHMTHPAIRNHGAFMTVREVADHLRVSEETIRRRFDDGELRGVRLGSVRRILASELVRLTDIGRTRQEDER